MGLALSIVAGGGVLTAVGDPWESLETGYGLVLARGAERGYTHSWEGNVWILIFIVLGPPRGELRHLSPGA